MINFKDLTIKLTSTTAAAAKTAATSTIAPSNTQTHTNRDLLNSVAALGVVFVVFVFMLFLLCCAYVILWTNWKRNSFQSQNKVSIFWYIKINKKHRLLYACARPDAKIGLNTKIFFQSGSGSSVL